GPAIDGGPVVVELALEHIDPFIAGETHAIVGRDRAAGACDGPVALERAVDDREGTTRSRGGFDGPATYQGAIVIEHDRVYSQVAFAEDSSARTRNRLAGSPGIAVGQGQLFEADVLAGGDLEDAVPIRPVDRYGDGVPLTILTDDGQILVDQDLTRGQVNDA